MVSQHLWKGVHEIFPVGVGHCGCLTFLRGQVKLKFDIIHVLGILLLKIWQKLLLVFDSFGSEWLQGSHRDYPRTHRGAKVFCIEWACFRPVRCFFTEVRCVCMFVGGDRGQGDEVRGGGQAEVFSNPSESIHSLAYTLRSLT